MRNAQLQRNLVDACYFGDSRKAASYLQGGAKPNRADERGYYPLHMACQEGHFSIVNLLLKTGAKLNVKDDHGKGETALFRAVGEGHLRIVKCLIKNGCNVNLRRGGPQGDTPLHIACGWGRFNEAVELVNAGANVNALDDERQPPIYHAVANGHSEIAAFLIKVGALAINKASGKKALLDIATANKDKKMLRVLGKN
jgi:ankyrin repeat protein